MGGKKKEEGNGKRMEENAERGKGNKGRGDGEKGKGNGGMLRLERRIKGKRGRRMEREEGGDTVSLKLKTKEECLKRFW